MGYANGFDPKDGAQAPNPDSIEMHKAGGAISVGSLVAASTADATGQTVVVCSATLGAGAAAMGVYTGKGGTGAATTVSGLSGSDVLTGDMIQVVKRGIVAIRAAAQTITSMVTFGQIALVHHGTTAGWVQEATAGSNNVIGTLWQTLTAGGTTTGSQVVVAARVAFR